MALTVGGTPVKSVYVGSTPVTAVYVGSHKVWPTRETVQITLGAGLQARDQLRAALSDRGLSYQTVTEIPFDIELVGTGSTWEMFRGYSSLTSVPAMDTSSVTNMGGMFSGCASLAHVPDLDTGSVTDTSWMFTNCSSLTSVPAMDTSQVSNMSGMFDTCSSLTSVPDMDTSQVTYMDYMFSDCSSLVLAPNLDTSQVTSMVAMFYGCSSLAYVPDMDTAQVTYTDYMFFNCAALTDGNVRLIGRHPNVNTTYMIYGSGLTREPWYNADGTPDDGPTIEVHEVSLTDVWGKDAVHPLVTVTVPTGQTWQVRIQGTVTGSNNSYSSARFQIGSSTSQSYNNSEVDFSGTITSSNSAIQMITGGRYENRSSSFVGTVTIEK